MQGSSLCLQNLQQSALTPPTAPTPLASAGPLAADAHDHARHFAQVTIAGFDLRLHPSGAVYLPLHRTWLIADAHFGKATSFRRWGVPVPSGTTQAMLTKLTALTQSQATQQFIFLGDFLHSAQAQHPSVQSALNAWRTQHPELQLTLVRGNHDQHAGDPPPELNMTVVDEPWLLVNEHSPATGLSRLALCHHPKAVDGAYVLAGHWHPCVSVSGKAGDRLRLPCFWFGDDAAPKPARAVGVLPAFGAFTGMHSINRQPGDRVFAIAGEVIRELPALRRIV
jgi:DNA ligase-associated metallophosphoesterase